MNAILALNNIYKQGGAQLIIRLITSTVEKIEMFNQLCDTIIIEDAISTLNNKQFDLIAVQARILNDIGIKLDVNTVDGLRTHSNDSKLFLIIEAIRADLQNYNIDISVYIPIIEFFMKVLTRKI